MTNIEKYNEIVFESIKHINEYGQEYWKARELSKVLEYTEFNKFEPVIGRAISACLNSNINPLDHFAEVSDMVQIGSGATREVGSKVRQTIEELGGTMPENLPTPEKSIQQLKKESKKSLK